MEIWQIFLGLFLVVTVQENCFLHLRVNSSRAQKHVQEIPVTNNFIGAYKEIVFKMLMKQKEDTHRNILSPIMVKPNK